MEERMRDPLGMLPKTRWEAAHLAKACAWKFAHLDIRGNQLLRCCNNNVTKIITKNYRCHCKGIFNRHIKISLNPSHNWGNPQRRKNTILPSSNMKIQGFGNLKESLTWRKDSTFMDQKISSSPNKVKEAKSWNLLTLDLATPKTTTGERRAKIH